MNQILLVDDEVKLLRILHSNLEKKGYDVVTASNGQEARRKMAENEIDIIFLDLMLPDSSGLELLQEFIGLYPQKIYIIMTAFGNIESAVTSMKAGAFDYIVKPAKLDEILVVIEKATQWLEMQKENLQLKEKLKNLDAPKQVFGTSPAMKRILQVVERVANTDATILLTGESGTGKSMIAHRIHDLSGRKQGAFISVNCAAIPEQLLESELFGYEKGAFTGASQSRSGKFEAADGGTIFLDEIGEISASLQAKLLQVTQEKSFMRLGSNTLKHVDVRILSATNRDLKQMVQEGRFRKDLYYRLNIVDIYIPPLRERQDEIPLLIEEFLERYRQRNNRNYMLSAELLDILQAYPWPGNVRELENAMERAVVLCRGDQLSVEDFPREIQENRTKQHNLMTNSKFTLPPGTSLPTQMDLIEKQLIMDTLEDSQGNAAMAARKLGISRQNLLYKMNKYFIHV